MQMALVRYYHKFSDTVCKISEYIIMVMLAVMVVITGAQIVCRVFFTALVWSEEATRFLLCWSTFIGAACVYKHAGHIKVTVLQDHLPGKVRDYCRILVHLLCCILFVIMIFVGFKYCGKMKKQLSPAMRIPMGYVYLCIPIGGILMLIHALDAILQELLGKKLKSAEEAES